MSSGASMSQDDLDKLFGGGDEPEPAAPAAEEEVLDLGAVATVEDEPIGLVEGLKPGEADLAFVDPEPEAEEMDMAALMAAEARAAAAAPAPEPEPEPVVVEPVRRVRPQAVERDDEQLLSEATGATVNAARALGLEDRGRLVEGLRADFSCWRAHQPAELAYWLGGRLCAGKS